MANYDGGVDSYWQDARDGEPSWWRKSILTGVESLEEEWWNAPEAHPKHTKTSLSNK